MAVHIFVVSEENFKICIRHGLAAIPGGARPDINDQLVSRMVMIRPGDRILFYIKGKKEIHGVYRAVDRVFYDETPVWSLPEGQIFPYRIKIDNSANVFEQPLFLSDIYDLRDSGKLWTFSLERPSGRGNSMFAISDVEFEEIFQLFLKVNQVYKEPPHIKEPYRHIEPNSLSKLHYDADGQPKYESTLASLFLSSLSKGMHYQQFGIYSDYLAYVPTSFQKEIDALLFHTHPSKSELIVAYTIIELKRDAFTEDGLSQMLRYEDWFLKMRVNGDSRAIRTVAIAQNFSEGVIDYLGKREQLEGKKAILMRYEVVDGLLCLKIANK
jgi:hypothetical protein